MRKLHPSVNSPWRWVLWRLGWAKCIACGDYSRLFVAWNIFITPNEEQEEEEAIGPYCHECYGAVFRREQQT